MPGNSKQNLHLVRASTELNSIVFDGLFVAYGPTSHLSRPHGTAALHQAILSKGTVRGHFEMEM